MGLVSHYSSQDLPLMWAAVVDDNSLWTTGTSKALASRLSDVDICVVTIVPS
ncbi:hypothetical protein LINGRAHAP2_LOCUS30334 [Linum grandiflorum]